jgi:hypothetical protein
MAFENVKISAASETAWGRLVKTWATGKSNFPTVSIDKLTVPRTLDDLKAQCTLVGVEITIPAKITGLAVIQHGPETLALRLPAKAMVEAAEADLDQGLTYAIPHFYTVFCGPLNVPQAQRKDFQACRIGDYSIASCL